MKPGVAGFSLPLRAQEPIPTCRGYYCLAVDLLVALGVLTGAVLLFLWCFLTLVVVAGAGELV